MKPVIETLAAFNEKGSCDFVYREEIKQALKLLSSVDIDTLDDMELMIYCDVLIISGQTLAEEAFKRKQQKHDELFGIDLIDDEVKI